jgi:hypothetical protein
MSAHIATKEELKDKVKSCTFDELEKKIVRQMMLTLNSLLWFLYVNDLSITKPKAYVWIKKAAFNKQSRATFALGLLYYY